MLLVHCLSDLSILRLSSLGFYKTIVEKMDVGVGGNQHVWLQVVSLSADALTKNQLCVGNVLTCILVGSDLSPSS